MTGVVKQFPGVRALDGIDLRVVAGEVHCLLGHASFDAAFSSG